MFFVFYGIDEVRIRTVISISIRKYMTWLVNIFRVGRSSCGNVHGRVIGSLSSGSQMFRRLLNNVDTFVRVNNSELSDLKSIQFFSILVKNYKEMKFCVCATCSCANEDFEKFCIT